MSWMSERQRKQSKTQFVCFLYEQKVRIESIPWHHFLLGDRFLEISRTHAAHYFYSISVICVRLLRRSVNNWQNYLFKGKSKRRTPFTRQAACTLLQLNSLSSSSLFCSPFSVVRVNKNVHTIQCIYGFKHTSAHTHTQPTYGSATVAWC